MFDPRRVSAHSLGRRVVSLAQVEQQDALPTSPTACWDYQTFAVPVRMQLGAQGYVSAFSRDRSETFRLLASGRQTADSGHGSACHDPIKYRISFLREGDISIATPDIYKRPNLSNYSLKTPGLYKHSNTTPLRPPNAPASPLAFVLE